MSTWLDGVLGVAAGLASSTLFILALFIGFCVLFGLVKLEPTAGAGGVVRSLDEVLSHQPVHYFSPDDPRGRVDQLHTPELRDAATRPS